WGREHAEKSAPGFFANDPRGAPGPALTRCTPPSWHCARKELRCRSRSAMAHSQAHSDTARNGATTTSLRYELLTLGDELLLGLIGNTHLTWIGAELGRRGVLPQRIVNATDDAGATATQTRERR